MKPLFLLFISFLWLQAVSAQNEICITYDAAGNRTQRVLCCTNCLTESDLEDRHQETAAEADHLTVVPNPTAGAFTLHTEGVPADAQVVLHNISGEILLRQQLGDGQFDISNYPPGTYVIHVMYADQQKTVLFEKTRQ